MERLDRVIRRVLKGMSVREAEEDIRAKRELLRQIRKRGESGRVLGHFC